jgi:hypothetical protein
MIAAGFVVIAYKLRIYEVCGRSGPLILVALHGAPKAPVIACQGSKSRLAICSGRIMGAESALRGRGKLPETFVSPLS